MMDGMNGQGMSGMMAGMGIFGILLLVALLLGIVMMARTLMRRP